MCVSLCVWTCLNVYACMALCVCFVGVDISMCVLFVVFPLSLTQQKTTKTTQTVLAKHDNDLRVGELTCLHLQFEIA